jgi:hypothetical protein
MRNVALSDRLLLTNIMKTKMKSEFDGGFFSDLEALHRYTG